MWQQADAEFPKRVKQHISETKSAQLLRGNLPRDWIVRELSERDYGLDVLIEITDKGRVTGNMVAGQLKATESFQFPKRKEQKNFRGIRLSTYNYLLNLPTPSFIFVCSLGDERIYWRSLREVDRESSTEIAGAPNIVMHRGYDLSDSGKISLKLFSLLERQWPSVERAVLGALMFYNALGPLFLACKREHQTKPAPLAVHLLLLQHYEYNSLIYRYLFVGSKKQFHPLPEIYEDALSKRQLSSKGTFSIGFIFQTFKSFIYDYLDAIQICHSITRDTQKAYWFKKYPFVMTHLEAFPPYFVVDDWSARYYWDEYESETKNINLDLFTDIDDGTRSDFAEFTKLR
jgi:hypothetical protein